MFYKLLNKVGLTSYCCVPCSIFDNYEKTTLKKYIILKHQITSLSYRGSNILFVKSLRTRVNDSTRSETVRVILFTVMWKVLRFVNNSTAEEMKQ